MSVAYFGSYVHIDRLVGMIDPGKTRVVIIEVMRGEELLELSELWKITATIRQV